jgi:hypothetical protein
MMEINDLREFKTFRGFQLMTASQWPPAFAEASADAKAMTDKTAGKRTTNSYFKEQARERHTIRLYHR